MIKLQHKNPLTSQITKNLRINNITTHKNKYSHSNKTTNHLFPSTFKYKTNINNSILEKVKHNYLQSHFNKRNNTSKQIHRENDRIHKRLNSQTSIYSQDKLSKSRISNRSLSRNSSRVSSQSSRSKIKTKVVEKKILPKINVECQEVNQMKPSQINQFKDIFLRTTSQKSSSRKSGTLSKNKIGGSFHLRQQKPQNQSKNNFFSLGDMLHRIAQDYDVSNNKAHKNESKTIRY